MPDIEINCGGLNSFVDEEISINITGLNSEQSVVLHSYTTIDNGNIFESTARYIADLNGKIDLTVQKSVGGQYLGLEPMGLFWSMQSSPKNKFRFTQRFVKVDVTTPLVVNIAVYDDPNISTLEEIHSLNPKELQCKEMAKVSINRWFMDTAAKRIPLIMEKDGVHGTIFLPPGKGPFPGVVTMFGRALGALEYRASLMSSHGFATFALSFFGVPGLHYQLKEMMPKQLDLEYFENAVNTFIANPSVSKEGVGVIGSSTGGFLAMAMANYLEKVSCAVSVNGITYPVFSDVKYKNTVMKAVPLVNFNLSDSKESLVPRNHVQKIPGSSVDFHKLDKKALMFVASMDDHNTPSEYFIEEVEKLLKQENHPHYKLLRYPAAGHLLEPPYTILNKTLWSRGEPCPFEFGGEMYAHTRSQEHCWKQQIQFFSKYLKPAGKLMRYLK